MPTWGEFANSSIYETDKSGNKKDTGRPTYHEGDSSKKPYIRIKTKKGKNWTHMGYYIQLAKKTTYILTAKILW
jgi:hypothetical protein